METNAFVQHVTNTTETENGCRTNMSSLNACVDLFFSGAVSKDISETQRRVRAALKEDSLAALKICFYLRDARDGQGKRDVLRALVDVLVSDGKQNTLRQILPYFPEIGRWKDIFEQVQKFDAKTLAVVKDIIESVTPDKFALMCKWMPRKGDSAKVLTSLLGLSPKVYRRFIVDGTNVVEQLMCAKKWSEIDFSKLPSAAAKLYQNAFKRNCSTEYNSYIAKLATGEAKVNSSTLYPHDITSAIYHRNGVPEVLDAQWKALPDYMEGSEKFNVFPIIDTSGSMSDTAYGNTSCLDVATGLGIYLSQHNRGAFKDVWCNFSNHPKIYKLTGGTIKETIEGLDYHNWDQNTNIEAVFELILKVSVENHIPAKDMPKVILIVSDMEFDRCTDSRTAMGMIDQKYAAAGYERPVIVFWNVNSIHKNSPVTINEDKTILIGGYSPTIMKDLLKGNLDNLNPLTFMYEVIDTKYMYLNELF